MFQVVPTDPVQAADCAMHHLLSLQPADESVWQFLMRLADQEQGKAAAMTARLEQSVRKPRAKRVAAIMAEMPRHAITGKPYLGVTKHWPPPIGYYYTGAWPPSFKTRSTGRSKRTVNMRFQQG